MFDRLRLCKCARSLRLLIVDDRVGSEMPVTTDNVDDPVELMLKKTGCIELHYKVQVRHCPQFNTTRLNLKCVYFWTI